MKIGELVFFFPEHLDIRVKKKKKFPNCRFKSHTVTIFHNFSYYFAKLLLYLTKQTLFLAIETLYFIIATLSCIETLYLTV